MQAIWIELVAVIKYHGDGSCIRLLRTSTLAVECKEGRLRSKIIPRVHPLKKIFQCCPKKCRSMDMLLISCCSSMKIP